MTRYEKVIAILDAAIGGPGATIGVHGAFWRGKTRDEFVALEVFSRQLVVVGNGAGSNLVKALKGEAPFGADLDPPPTGASMSRMPAGMEPVSSEAIAFIEQWIDDGCPEDPVEDEPEMSWRPTNAPVASSRTDDVFMIDANEGWAVNSNGSIIHTVDGFETIVVQFQDLPPTGFPPIYFRCLAFSGNKRGWAGTLTAGKTLFETTDGVNWTQVANLPSLARSAICGMYAVSDMVVYASGTNYPNRPARMMKTVDGGETWTAWSMEEWADLLVDCFFESPTRGWVVGGKTDDPNATPNRFNVKPVVLLTEDGGTTWTNKVDASGAEFPLGEWGWKIQFLTDQIAYVSLENFNDGAILKSSDGGETWTRIPINDPQQNKNLEGVGFINEQQGWVGGWGDATFQSQSSSETQDGGATWLDANHIGKAINRFRFIGNPVEVGYASGKTVYKYSSDSLPSPAAIITAAPSGSVIASITPGHDGVGVDLSLEVPEGTARLVVHIWDRFGELVATPIDEQHPKAGSRKINWNRTDAKGLKLPAGYFIVRVTFDSSPESDVFAVSD